MNNNPFFVPSFSSREGGLCWGHSVEDQIQGQISAGFAIIGFYEDIGHWLSNDYINTSMATKAVKNFKDYFSHKQELMLEIINRR